MAGVGESAAGEEDEDAAMGAAEGEDTGGVAT